MNGITHLNQKLLHQFIYRSCFIAKLHNKATLKFPKPNTKSQHYETVVQGRSLPPMTYHENEKLSLKKL
ncbi:MAG: hypothetical protein LBJ00_14005 [Planctomycetaceae bacterium]|nr:hypothetical protein [Planctomycetaceae bacterium]